MWFNIGILELALIGGAAFGSLISLCMRNSAWKLAAVVALCLAMASILTPADPASTLLMGALLLMFFAGGFYFRASQARLTT